ncbi:MAG: tetratricopeptide repeat protein [Methyloceanibacter sp.]
MAASHARNFILAGAVLAVMSVGGAIAGPLEEAWAAYGRGDYATALRLWRPLAAQGNAFAQSNLGFMYDSGQGVPQDHGEAAKWYRLAAEQGNARAQSNLGSMYAGGDGVPRDYVQAHMWASLAASRFPASAAEDRKQAAENRDRVASLMTQAQIAEAQKLAREWKPK